MRWTVLNALGALAWLAGLSYAKGMSMPGGILAGDEHRLLIGMAICGGALLLLLWSNLRGAV